MDLGFRVLKIDTSNMADVYYAPDALDQGQLELLHRQHQARPHAEDLLFQVMLDWGVDLALPISQQDHPGQARCSSSTATRWPPASTPTAASTKPS